jgi:argininosuccinate lyase
MTELADRLVRDHDISFSKAHAMAAGFLSGDVSAISSKYSEGELARIISARNFVEVRRTPGGPAPAETMRALGISRDLLDRDRAWLDEAQQKIEDAAAIRRQRAQSL